MTDRVRADPSELEDLLVDGAWDAAIVDVANSDAKDGVAGAIRIAGIDAQADPPLDKFYALCEAQPKFKASWDRKRSDLPDGSPSSYDLSLANFAVRDGWADDEIVALLVAKRRRWREKLKRHVSYYTNTIAAARTAHEAWERKREEARQESERRRRQEEARARLLDALDGGCDGGGEEPIDDLGDTPRPRAGNPLDPVSDLLNVRIKRFIQFDADPPTYRLETEDGAVTLGDASAFLSFAKFKAAVFSATRRVIPRFKDREWDRIAQALADAIVIEAVGDQAKDAGQAEVWVSSYVSKHPPINAERESADDAVAGEAYLGNRAFWKNERLHIWSERLQQYLATSYFDKVKSGQMAIQLRILGAAPARVNAYMDPDNRKHRVNKSAWQLPDMWRLHDEEDSLPSHDAHEEGESS